MAASAGSSGGNLPVGGSNSSAGGGVSGGGGQSLASSGSGGGSGAGGGSMAGASGSNSNGGGAGGGASSSGAGGLGTSGAPGTGCAAGGYLICEDFESTALGATPDGWTKHGDASGVADDAAKHGTHSLKLGAVPASERRIYHDASAAGAAHWGRIFYKVQ